jgi:hypothetical protein
MQLGSWAAAARKAQGRPCRRRRREDLGGDEAKTLAGRKRECHEEGGKQSINCCQVLRKGHDGTSASGPGPAAQQFDNQLRSVPTAGPDALSLS